MEDKNQKINEVDYSNFFTSNSFRIKKIDENEGYNCPRCSSLIEVVSINEDELQYKCINNNNHNNRLKIDEYLERMKKYIDKKNIIEKCEIHELEYKCYCNVCKIHICKECLRSKDHKYHGKEYIYEIQPNDD